MRILVTGANGQLGNEMRLIAKFRNADEFIFSDISEHPCEPTLKLDITAPISLEGPLDYIVNCAAYTNVDAAEDNAELAGMLNCTAVGNLAALALQKNAALIHISTDYVFDGMAAKPLREDDAVCPVSVYGRTKLEGERVLEASGCRYVIIRTAWLYSEFGKNFMKTMLRLCSQLDKVRVVNDQTGSPTYALDLAKAITVIMDRGVDSLTQGTYHFSNEGKCTWYDFASRIASLSGHEGAIVPCSSDEYPSKVKRPAYSVLCKDKIRSVFGVEVPVWEDSLKACYASFKALDGASL